MQYLRLAAAVAALLLCLSSGPHPALYSQTPAVVYAEEVVTPTPLPVVERLRGNDRILSSNYSVFDTLPHGFSYYAKIQNPLAYDAASTTLVTIKRGSSEDDPANLSNSIYLRWSGDNGRSWSAHYGPLQDLDAPLQQRGRYPSLFLQNAGQGGVADLRIFHGIPFSNSGWGTYGSGLTSGGATKSTKRFEHGGFSSEGVAYSWVNVFRISATPDGKTFVALGGVLPDENQPALNNAVAVLRVDMESGAKAESFIPPALASAKFVPPTGETSHSRTNLITGLGWDENGTLFTGILGRYTASTNQERQHPAVSRSSDGGRTWSELDFIPLTQLTSYFAQLGLDPNLVGGTLSSVDMIVTGPEQLSIIADIIDKRSESDFEDELPILIHHVTEFVYRAGSWTIRPIARNTMIRTDLIVHQPTEDDMHIQASQTWTENQLAMTADGEYLIAKWVDYVRHYVDEQEVVTTDVFMAQRHKDAQFWSAPVNVTDSELFDKITRIPSIVPALDDIPLLRNHTILLPEEDTWPEQERAQHFLFRPQELRIHHVNLIEQTVDAGDLPAQDVSIALHAPWPNPVASESLLQFRLARSGHVALSLINPMGSTVREISNGYFQAGDHSFKFNSDGLANGRYLLLLRAGEETRVRRMLVRR